MKITIYFTYGKPICNQRSDDAFHTDVQLSFDRLTTTSSSTHQTTSSSTHQGDKDKIRIAARSVCIEPVCILV